MKNTARLEKNEIIDLIQGERSAIETYRQVFQKYGADPQLDELRKISAEHKQAVLSLSDDAESMDIEPPTSSGAWGNWAKVVTGTAKTFGEPAALKALKEGEVYGLNLYKKALKSPLPPHLKSRIENVFIPTQKRHIQKIDSIIESL